MKDSSEFTASIYTKKAGRATITVWHKGLRCNWECPCFDKYEISCHRKAMSDVRIPGPKCVAYEAALKIQEVFI